MNKITLTYLIFTLLVAPQLANANCSSNYSKIAQVRKAHPFKSFQGTWSFYVNGKKLDLEIMPVTVEERSGPPYFSRQTIERAKVYLNGVEIPVRVVEDGLEVMNGGVDGIKKININASARAGRHLDLEIFTDSNKETSVIHKNIAVNSKLNVNYDKEVAALKLEESLRVRSAQLNKKLAAEMENGTILYADYLDPTNAKYESGYLVVRLNTIGKSETLTEAQRLELPKTYYGYPVLLQDLTLERTYEQP